jgi:hypothetical protein
MDTSRGSGRGRVHGAVLLGRRGCFVAGDLGRRHLPHPRQQPPTAPNHHAPVHALGSVLTFTRHRKPGPLIVTIAAGLWIYLFTFAVGASPDAAERHDTMGADVAPLSGWGSRS